MSTIQIDLNSEIGPLQSVIVHQPGQEIENMTPETAAEVLYDDILNLDLALAEYRQLTGVLRRVSKAIEFKGLLTDILGIGKVREALVDELCQLFECPDVQNGLLELSPDALAAHLVEGTPMRKDTLEKFLSSSRYAIPPLPNMFFTRDATMAINDRLIIGSMAYRARLAEALLLKAVFKHHPSLESGGFYFDGTTEPGSEITIEGGDLLVIRENLAVVGYSERTSAAGIDRLMQAIAANGPVTDFIVVEIPKTRATIHLDMIFTMVDTDACVVFPPLITGRRRCRAFHVRFENGRRGGIVEYDSLLEALRAQGVDLRPISCGGDDDFHQEREQWASGANFFAFAPGQIIGYAHNTHTVEALDASGFGVVGAEDVITGKHEIESGEKLVVLMDGAELSRGGGGCRCMTMPLARKPIEI